MKAALWYLLAGLEVWLGVSAILLGLYAMLAMLSAHTASILEVLACVAAIVLGAGLVVDAVRREISGRTGKSGTERFESPLDSPTRPGQA